MKRLRLEQRKDEPADQFALRALGMALPRMERDHFIALADYMTARATAERWRYGAFAAGMHTRKEE
jgi:hypothetical protein